MVQITAVSLLILCHGFSTPRKLANIDATPKNTNTPLALLELKKLPRCSQSIRPFAGGIESLMFAIVYRVASLIQNGWWRLAVRAVRCNASDVAQIGTRKERYGRFIAMVMAYGIVICHR
mmetsp:Transcript_35981/g.63102  ORF Transcript_35981/g.63102 Transcript_35981/m.63102 type:complete len:120 (+) Transcript_35981:1918-2277(+)